MKILPITNQQTTHVNHKGRIERQTYEMLAELSGTLLHQMKLCGMQDKITKAFFIDCIKRSDNVLKNVETIMKRFGKSCSLEIKKSEKSDLHRFFITSPNSYYKHVCGDIYLNENSPKASLFNLEEFVDSFAKTDPYETNFRFKIQRKEKSLDLFAPEQDFDFIEDKLLKIEPSKNAASRDDIKAYLKQAKEEGLI